MAKAYVKDTTPVKITRGSKNPKGSKKYNVGRKLKMRKK